MRADSSIPGQSVVVERLPFVTDLPARLDRLRWSGWHWLVVTALGITWILDGLEVTVVGALGPRLEDRAGLALTPQLVGAASTAYLLGAVAGALGFGYLTDRLGRKRLFLVTLGWYALFTVLTAFSWDFLSFALFRFLCGMGIGGEYSAINSAIDELIPARHRGWVDLAVNGSWWFGTILGSAESIVLLDPRIIDQHLGWRLAFGLGAVLALVVMALRRVLPESPRWLLVRGRLGEASTIVHSIEQQAGARNAEPPAASIAIDPRRVTRLADVVRVMILLYPRRTVYCLCLMVSQAFLYNAIFFTEALVLTTFFGVNAQNVGYYIFPFALGNLLGPLVLGRAFDTIGRKTMIAATYLISGGLLAVTAVLFVNGVLDARTITLAWSIVFFFASAGASAAYLTVSELFPLETRALAIAVVYAVGTLVGGAGAPYLFGVLVASKSSAAVAGGYALGAAAMMAGGIVTVFLGVAAERQPLEAIAAPLALVTLPGGEPASGA